MRCLVRHHSQLLGQQVRVEGLGDSFQGCRETWTRARYGVVVEQMKAVTLHRSDAIPARTLPDVRWCQRQLMAFQAENADRVALHDLFGTDLRIPPWQVSEDVDTTRHF